MTDKNLSAWQSVQGRLGAQLGAHRSVNVSHDKLPSRKTFLDAESGKSDSALCSGGHLHGLNPTSELSCSPSPLLSVCRGILQCRYPNHGQERQGSAGASRVGNAEQPFNSPKAPFQKGRLRSACERSSLSCVFLPPAELSAGRGGELILAASPS